MSPNELFDQKIAGILGALDSAPAAQLHRQVSQQYAENYNQAREGILAHNPDLKAVCPPVIEIDPDGAVQATYLEVKTYCGELSTFLHNKVAAGLRKGPSIALPQTNGPKIPMTNVGI